MTDSETRKVQQALTRSKSWSLRRNMGSASGRST